MTTTSVMMMMMTAINDYDDDLSSLSALLRDPLLSSPDDRAPSLLRVLVGGRLVLGSVDDREPLHEPACISAAVKPRNEVLPLGNADVSC